VQASINGADTFPDVFAAVDSALVASPRDARTTKARRKGRPARKNLLSLVCLGDHGDDYKFPTLGVQGYVDAVDEAEADWLNSSWYWTGWAKPSLGDDREAALLESEWNLRVVLLGRQFTDAVLACQAPGANPRHEAAVRRVLGQIELVLGQTASKGARDAYASELEDAVKDWPDTVISDAERTTFWASATTRANVYEAVLQRFYPTYNTRHNASLASRPDLVVSPYVPASIIQQGALRRTAHLIEFTSLKVPDAKSLHNYLGLKLPNYVQMTQEL
jgi:hypothetical protein